VTITPSACRHCGVERREHAQRWTEDAGWHVWTAPTQQQIKDRMKARRQEATADG
jgi:hypothetical protein